MKGTMKDARHVAKRMGRGFMSKKAYFNRLNTLDMGRQCERVRCCVSGIMQKGEES